MIHVKELYVCKSCEAEFEVLHERISEPEWCPFCGEYGLDQPSLDTDLDEVDEDDDDSGC